MKKTPKSCLNLWFSIQFYENKTFKSLEYFKTKNCATTKSKAINILDLFFEKNLGIFILINKMMKKLQKNSWMIKRMFKFLQEAKVTNFFLWDKVFESVTWQLVLRNHVIKWKDTPFLLENLTFLQVLVHFIRILMKPRSAASEPEGESEPKIQAQI